MSIFRALPPTAGFPIRLKELASFLGKSLPGKRLEDDFTRYLDVPYAAVTYSGTAALYLILKSLKEISPKKTVVIPAFVCPLVALAIKKAGLNTTVCDINRDDFNFSLPQLENICSENDDILAVVAVHLAGIPLDFAPINELVKSRKIFIIEDCAQSLGAEYQGRRLGKLGDFAFFSLCRGKGLTMYEGGVAAAGTKEYAALIDKKIKELVKDDFFSEALKIAELFGYWIFYRPLLFWWIFYLPQAFWKWRKLPLKAFIEYFPAEFPTHRVSGIRKKIAHASFARLEKELSSQSEKASRYIERLKGVKGIKIIGAGSREKASWPYLTLLFDHPDKRQKALEILGRSGLGASLIYLEAITDYGYLKEATGGKACPNARSIARRHLTLTTSCFLKDSELENIAKILKEL